MITFKNKWILLAALVLIGTGGTTSATAGDVNRAVVYTEHGPIVRTISGGCVRTKWQAEDNSCAAKFMASQQGWGKQKKVVQQVKKQRPVNTFSNDEKTVYFVFNRAVLTDEGKRRLNTLASALKADQSVKEAKIVGYADRIGSDTYNEKLSKKRAEAVRDYLIYNGYTNASVTETRWVGEREPSTDCAATRKSAQLISCLQKDRRVEVEIDYIHEKKRAEAQ